MSWLLTIRQGVFIVIHHNTSRCLEVTRFRVLSVISFWNSSAEQSRRVPNLDRFENSPGFQIARNLSPSCCNGSIATKAHCSLETPVSSCNFVNVGSGNGLVLNSTKPIPAPMLTFYQWDHVVIT